MERDLASAEDLGLNADKEVDAHLGLGLNAHLDLVLNAEVLNAEVLNAVELWQISTGPCAFTRDVNADLATKLANNNLWQPTAGACAFSRELEVGIAGKVTDDLNFHHSTKDIGQAAPSSSSAWATTELFIPVHDWASAPEEGAWAAGAWGPGQWKPKEVPQVEVEPYPHLHWSLQNFLREETPEKIEKAKYIQLRQIKRQSFLELYLAEDVDALKLIWAEEICAIDCLYLPYSFWLEDNQEIYSDPQNVPLCRLYDEFRLRVLPGLYMDIRYPNQGVRSLELSLELKSIVQQAKDTYRSIIGRGNAAMPVPFQWWLDLDEERRRLRDEQRRAEKVALGKLD